MKAICLAVSLVTISLSAAAQTKPLTLSLFPKPENKNAYLFQDIKKQPPQLGTIQPLLPGIHILPQDNMPCLVPDISSLAPMPILSFTLNPQGQIPNPYFDAGRKPAEPK